LGFLSKRSNIYKIIKYVFKELKGIRLNNLLNMLIFSNSYITFINKPEGLAIIVVILKVAIKRRALKVRRNK
jgi:hypothetical protein